MYTNPGCDLVFIKKKDQSSDETSDNTDIGAMERVCSSNESEDESTPANLDATQIHGDSIHCLESIYITSKPLQNKLLDRYLTRQKCRRTSKHSKPSHY